MVWMDLGGDDGSPEAGVGRGADGGDALSPLHRTVQYDKGLE